MNPIKALKVFGLLNKGESILKENQPMKLKLPHLVTLFGSLSATIGLPSLASSFVHAHEGVYAGIVTFALILHAILPSVFSAPSDADQQATGISKVAKLGVLLLLFALCSLPARAQTATPAPTPAPAAIQNIYAAGASWNGAGSASVAGSVLYAHLLADGTYAFTHIDAVPASVKPFTVTTNIGAGVAQKIATIGKYNVYVPAAAGISFSGANAGWQWNTGAAVAIPFGTKGYFLMPTVRFLQSNVSGGAGVQPIIGLLFGWGK
jgi:hypothetical protein